MEEKKVGLLKPKKKKASAKSIETPAVPAVPVEPSIFKTAWNLLNNIRDELTEPISLIRTMPTPGSIFVKPSDLEPGSSSVNLDAGNGNYPTIESYASTLPFELKISPPKQPSDMATSAKPLGPLPSIFASDAALASKTALTQKDSKSKNSRSLSNNRSSTTATAEKGSSSGINSILDDKGKPPGTHRSNQAESTAQEYQQLLDGIQSHYPFLPDNSEKTKPKGIHGTRSISRLSDMFPEPGSCLNSIRISDGQLYAEKQDQAPEQRLNPTQPTPDHYLQTVNDQLFRMNHERMRRQMSSNCPMHYNLLGRGPTINPSAPSQNEYGINQNNNVNINLTLALSQIQQGGHFEVGVPMPTPAAETEMQELKAPRPRPIIVEAKIRHPKVETAMQTELGLEDGAVENSANSSEVPSRTPSTSKFTSKIQQGIKNGTIQLSDECEIDESTSAFPSAIPSDQIWRKKNPASMAVPEGEGGHDSWSDYLGLPTALEYTNDSLKSFFEAADDIINTCVIPPDDNPMSDDEMNAEEDKVAISIMRLLGIPQQLRHNIYKEALYNFTAIQEVSTATLDILGNIIDWMSNGDCGGKEEILSKARFLASISTDFDPNCEVWAQFEKDIGVFTEAVGEAMKEGYEVGVEVVKKISSTVIQTMKASSSTTLSNPSVGTSSAGRRDSQRQLSMPSIAEEGQAPPIPERPPRHQTRSTSQGPQVRRPNSQSVLNSLRDTSHLDGAEYRTDPLEALDMEISKLIKVKETLQSQSNLSAATPIRPSMNDLEPSTGARLADAESLTSIQEPAYPNIQLVEGDDIFDLADDAEKRQLLRQCRNDARRLAEDINNRRSGISGASMSAFSHTPSRQYSEEPAVELPEDDDEPQFHRTTDALMEAPLGYDFGIGVAISSACSSIKSSILSQAQSAVSYFPLFQGDTPILGQSQCESRDERMEMEPEERYNPNMKHKPRRMGRSVSKLRFADQDDYFEDNSDSEIPEPTTPAPPAVPRRQSHSIVLKGNDVRMTSSSKRESAREESELDLEEGLSQMSLPDSQMFDSNNQSFTSVSQISEFSGCITPHRPPILSSSVQLENKTNTSPTVADDASDLTVLMEKLKPHWPTSGNLSPDEQMKMAMNSFIAATKSQKVTEFLGNAEILRTDPAEAELHEEESGLVSETSVTNDSYRKPKSPTKSSTPECEAVDTNESIATKPEDISGAVSKSPDTTQLHKELNQLEKIVQDMCSEVAGTKLGTTGSFEPSFGLTGVDEKPLKPSSSRIPVPTSSRVKTPFALPPRNQESVTTINLLPPKTAMVTTSCLSIDSTLGRRNESANAPRANYIQFSNPNPNRGSARHSAFGRSISSTPQSSAKLQKPPASPYQRTTHMNKKPNVAPQRKPISGPAKPTPKSQATKWIAVSSQQQQGYSRQSRRSSPSPSRQESQTAMVSRSNSYRELFQKKQTLIGKTNAPIQLRKPGAVNNEAQRVTTTGYGSSRSPRTRAPMIPNGRDPSRGRTGNVPAPALVADDQINTPVPCGGGGYLSVHGSGSRIHIPVNFVDTNANRWQPSGPENTSTSSAQAGTGNAAESQSS